MREEKIKIYRFNELSEDVQEKVIDRNREINVGYDWWEFTIDDLENELDELGVSIDRDSLEFDLYHPNIGILSNKITFPFETEVDLPKRIGAYSSYLGGGMNSSIKTTEIPVDKIYYEYEEEFTEGQIYDILNKTQGIFSKYLGVLNKVYDELISDEAIKDTLEINDFEFTEDGDIW
jgi:hypothetical protein